MISKIVYFLRHLSKSVYYAIKYNKDFDKATSYIMFIGYPRSGHSLVGAILDAHPHVVLSHELNVLQYLKWGFSRNLIFGQILDRSDQFVRSGGQRTGYTYLIPTQWQGKFNGRLMAIGDKKGGASTQMVKNDKKILNKLDDLEKNIKLIHVVRNPFDNITTRAKGGSHKNEMVNDSILMKTIEEHFTDVEIIQKIKDENKYEIMDVKLEDFISNPKENIKLITRFIGVSYDEQYLEDCSGIVFDNPRKTRESLEWTENIKSLVYKKIEKYEVLRGYSFDK